MLFIWVAVALAVALIALIFAAISFSSLSSSSSQGKRGRRGCRGATGALGSTGPAGDSPVPPSFDFLVPYAGGPVVGLTETGAVPLSFAGFVGGAIPLSLYPPDDTLGLTSRASWAAPGAVTLNRLAVSYRGLVAVGEAASIVAEVWVSPACGDPFAITALTASADAGLVLDDVCTFAQAAVPIATNDKVFLVLRLAAGTPLAVVAALGISASISALVT